MHLVVVGKTQALQLIVEGHAQVVGDIMADTFTDIVVNHREEATQDRRAQQQQRRVDEGALRRRHRDASAQQVVSAVDRAAQVLRN